ncbi:MAG: MOSC N-terminal beta barrel domain-containing protein, partial [Streptosporangiaceae bacterium]
MSRPGAAGVRLASIHIYPMKAARAVDLDESLVEPWGLAGDRRWLLVDEDGRFVSQREEPALARVVVTYEPPAGTISLSAAGFPGGRVAVPAAGDGAGPGGRPPQTPPRGQPQLKVTVWSSAVLAAAAGPDGDAWFSAYLGRPVRLVYLDDPTRRPVDPEYGRDGDVVSFADGYPLLLTSTGSLDELGRWLAEDGEQPVPMTRF